MRQLADSQIHNSTTRPACVLKQSSYEDRVWPRTVFEWQRKGGHIDLFLFEGLLGLSIWQVAFKRSSCTHPSLLVPTRCVAIILSAQKWHRQWDVTEFLFTEVQKKYIICAAVAIFLESSFNKMMLGGISVSLKWDSLLKDSLWFSPK